MVFACSNSRSGSTQIDGDIVVILEMREHFFIALFTMAKHKSVFDFNRTDGAFWFPSGSLGRCQLSETRFKVHTFAVDNVDPRELPVMLR